jgi:putative transposase
MRHTLFAEGEYYHIYNRGVDKRTIFSTAADYRRFIAYLYLMNDIERADHSYLLRNFGGLASEIAQKKPRDNMWEPLVAIGAYCLMPNHFHLYVKPLADDGISKFMQRVQTGYTMYFNKKHARSGALFQGTFKAQHVDTDPYAKYLFSYIHLNPAKLKDPLWKERGARDLKALREHVRQYSYSSLGEYMSNEFVVTSPAAFPAYLNKQRDMDAHIDTWIAGNKHFGG